MNIKLKGFALINVCFAMLLTGCSQTPVKMAALEKNTVEVSHGTPLASELSAEDEYQFALDLARLNVTKQRFAKAETLLHKLRKEKPSDIRVYRLLAELYEQSERLDLSLTAWQEVNKNAQKTTKDEAQLARLAIMLERYELAKPIYEAWLNAANPAKQASALNNLGFVALLEGQVAQAQNYLKRALQIDPLNSKAIHNLKLVAQMDANADGLSASSILNSL